MFIKDIVKFFLRKRCISIYSKNYWNLFDKIKMKNPKLSDSIEKEDLWVKKWNKYKIPFTKDTIRIFSRFGVDEDKLFPLEFFPSLIEPVLSPRIYSILYEEKNMYDRLFAKENALPKTYFRNINGVFMNSFYQEIEFSDRTLNKVLESYTACLIKPTVDSGSGKGISFFYKDNKGDFYNSDKEKLTTALLSQVFGENYICQEVLEQSLFFKQFNPTSLNTLRVMVYRSIKDNKVRIPNIVLRIGGKGSLLDNAHAGGVFCGVNKNGVLNSFVCDWLGGKSSKHNDVNFSTTKIVIPNFKDIISFSEKIGESVSHCRLLALDIALDKNDKPRLIEINATGFGAWLFAFSGNSYFGEYTEEVLDYCSKHIAKSTVLQINL